MFGTNGVRLVSESTTGRQRDCGVPLGTRVSGTLKPSCTLLQYKMDSYQKLVNLFLSDWYRYTARSPTSFPARKVLGIGLVALTS